MKKILTLVIVSLLFLSLAVLPSKAVDPEEETSLFLVEWSATVDEVWYRTTGGYLPRDPAANDGPMTFFTFEDEARFYLDFLGYAVLEAHWQTLEGEKSISYWTISDFETYGYYEMEGIRIATSSMTGWTYQQSILRVDEITDVGKETIREAALEPFVVKTGRWTDGVWDDVFYLDEFFLAEVTEWITPPEGSGMSKIESVRSITKTYYSGSVEQGQSIRTFPPMSAVEGFGEWGAPRVIPFDETTQTFFFESDQPFFERAPFDEELLQLNAHWSVEVLPAPGNPPKIEEIIVTGDPDAKNPMTENPLTKPTEKVKFEAKITPAWGFEITRVSWSGDDLMPGEGNPYERPYAPGTHGKKRVVCTIFYRNIFTGGTGKDVKTKEFKLFFNKTANDDGDSEPNWFEYWKRDGAVPNMAGVRYNATSPYWGYCTAAGVVYLTPKSAGQHYSSPIVLTTFFGTESFGGPTVKGIDCAAEIIAHELYHKWVTDQWKAGHSFANKTDSDKGLQAPDCNDKLPDFYENATSHTLNNDTDTYDLEHLKSPTYRTYGDQEYMAMRAGDGSRGTDSNDWANPGKQSNHPPYGCITSMPYEGLVQAQFTGNCSDQGIDIDGDGSYDYLRVLAEVNVTNGGIFTIVGFLNDRFGDDITFINEPLTLDTGIQTIMLNFDGITIRRFGVNGSFNLSMYLSDEHGNEIDLQHYTTNVYNYTDFQIPAAGFSGIYSDQRIDMDGDGLYNYLTVNVEVDVTQPQSYIIEGWLYDSNGNDIIIATNSTYLYLGSQSVTLKLDGLAINRHRVNGPYNLRYLSLYSGNSGQIDFIYNAYNTSAYSYTDFQKTDAGFTGSYSDYGKDTDGDGGYNYLTVEVEIDVSTSGNYALVGWLYDNTDAEMVMATSNAYLDAGSQTVPLDFDGVSIYDHEVDGPYDLKYLTLYDENGSLIDTLNYAYTTSAYICAQFGDTVSPIISFLFPENKTYATKDVPLTFTINETTSWIGYSLDGQANVTISGNATLPSLLDGLHHVVVYANDTAGNMGASSTVYFTVDTTHPNIIEVSQTPTENNVLPEDEVKVNATVTDDLSGVKQVALNFTNGNGTWITVGMTNLEGNIWNSTIPAFPYCTNVTYVIIAEDNANNTITTEEMEYEYQYHVIPEFPLFLILPLFMMATLLAVIVYRRKHFL